MSAKRGRRDRRRDAGSGSFRDRARRPEGRPQGRPHGRPRERTRPRSTGPASGPAPRQGGQRQSAQGLASRRCWAAVRLRFGSRRKLPSPNPSNEPAVWGISVLERCRPRPKEESRSGPGVGSARGLPQHNRAARPESGPHFSRSPRALSGCRRNCPSTPLSFEPPISANFFQEPIRVAGARGGGEGDDPGSRDGHGPACRWPGRAPQLPREAPRSGSGAGSARRPPHTDSARRPESGPPSSSRSPCAPSRDGATRSESGPPYVMAV
jgi:hypothetical protein